MKYEDAIKKIKKLLDDAKKQGHIIIRVEDIDSSFPELKETTNVVKIEPKFKVGDWIIYSGDHYEGVRHITKINENGYYINRNGLPHGIIPFNDEICMRLWTIDDAKEGDVLAYPDGSLVIFKYRLSGLDTGLYMGSVLLTDKIEFARTCTILNTKPATEKQRNILFEALKEAGYEWDNINKEAKKLH